MQLFIKNMVCDRCKAAVVKELEQVGLHPILVKLGEVSLKEEQVDSEQRHIMEERLKLAGFELLDDKKSRIIEQIKNVIVTLVHHSGEPSNLKNSELITQKLLYDYPYLSNLFSEIEGITIEQYIIQQKAEKVKELITYDELSFSEIAYKLGYSSVAHLSAQFKKVTGLTPSYFKKKRNTERIGLDKVGKE